MRSRILPTVLALSPCVFLPGPDLLDISERRQRGAQVLAFLAECGDAPVQVAHHLLRRQARLGCQAIGTPELALDVDDFLVQFPQLFLQDLVVVRQPRLAHRVESVLADVFQFQLQLQKYGRDARANLGGRLRRDGTRRDLGYPR